MKNNTQKLYVYILTVTTLLIVACLNITKAEAKPIPELTRYIQEEVTRVNESVISSTKEAPSGDSQQDNYFLKNMLIRLRATFGIEVTWVAKFEIVPEVELVYLREMR